MKTERKYYFNDAYTWNAKVLEVNGAETGGTIILDETIFVAQGGGQRADTGTIGNTSVTHVEAPKDSPETILHTVADIRGFAPGMEVELKIDVPRRELHSRLHTAGHLVAAAVEAILPGAKAAAGHHWPSEARVEFSFGNTLPLDFETNLMTAIESAVSHDLSVRRFLANDGERFIQIGDYPAVRCGGTHCWHLKAIGVVLIRGFKLKKDRLRVGYDVGPAAIGNRGS